MIKILATVLSLLVAGPAMAAPCYDLGHVGNCLSPAEVKACPSQWFQVIDGSVFCVKGEAWEAAGRPRENPPVIVDMSHGAPIAHCERNEYCPGYGPSHGYPNMGGKQ